MQLRTRFLFAPVPFTGDLDCASSLNYAKGYRRNHRKYVTRGGVNQYKLVRVFNACSSSWVFIPLLS